MSLKVGIVGTGYAAQKRAEAFRQEERAKLVAVTGNTPDRVNSFARDFEIASIASWQELIDRADLDMIAICTFNQAHAAIARAALEAGKHVVVEYPLALEASVAAEIIELSRKQQKLLHVEHMELIGGLHQGIKDNLAAIGNIFSARYTTIAPQHPVPRNWKYHREKFGFPLCAALSRLHRLTDLFGRVKSVTCQSRWWQISDSEYFSACFCDAQLLFENDVIANIIYGKGDTFWQSDRNFEINGDKGSLIFQGERGTLIQEGEQSNLSVRSRRGLFAIDTKMVLDFLLEGKSLYLSPDDSYYALKVACAARQSAILGTTVNID